MDERWALSAKGAFVSGEDMSLAEANSVAAREPRARLLPVPARYRYPRITEAEAHDIASNNLARRVADRYPGLSFKPVARRSDDLMRFSFIASCDEWVDEGRIPGGLICSVDKVDGHVWTNKEFEDMQVRLGRL